MLSLEDRGSTYTGDFSILPENVVPTNGPCSNEYASDGGADNPKREWGAKHSLRSRGQWPVLFEKTHGIVEPDDQTTRTRTHIA